MPNDTFQVQMRVEPEGSSDSSVSIITQIAVQVGADRVTFGVPQYNDAARPQVVWVDGKPSAIDETNPVLTLDGGTVTEVSSNEYRIALKTGETVTVNPFGDGMGFNVDLGPNAAPGSVQGFLGPDEGQAKDFSLPDGTVLKQPLTQDQLYHTFADAWRVTDATSLLDYDPGQTTASFTNTQYPREILTLADFPADLVAKALALASAAGITDPTLAKDAAFDYISMGNPSFFSEDATVAGHNPTKATEAAITQTTTPDPSIGILPASPAVKESTGATTPVTFSAVLTRAAATDTVVNYVVTPNVDYLSNTAGKTFFTASDFGGTLPSGSVTIKAGQTEADVTVEVPNSALGSAPGKWLGLSITTPGDDPIYTPTAQAEVLNNAPVAGAPAAPLLKLLPGTASGGTTPTLTRDGNTYTLDLGKVSAGTAPSPLQFALANAAAAGSDSLLSTILSTTGTGFTVSATQPSTAILAGSSYLGLSLQPLTKSLGAQSETITFTATDTNSSGYSAALPNITLVVKDTVVAATTTSPPVTPTIKGTVAAQATTGETSVAPFAKVTVADTNAGAKDSLTITVTGGGGTLTGAGLSGGTGGVYTLAATDPGTLTDELDALSFKATAGTPGTPLTTSFALKASSSAGTSTSDTTTTVVDTAATVAPPPPAVPTIKGTVADQATVGETSVAPFAKVTVADTNAGAKDSLTITVTGGNGKLTGAGLSGGTGGVYALAATDPGTLTTELDALSFAAAPGAPGVPTTTTFSLNASSSAGTSASDATTTVVDTPAAITTSPPVAPTIKGTVAAQATAGEASINPFAKVKIGDANPGAKDGLTITVTGGGGKLTGACLSGGTGGVYTLVQTDPGTLTDELDALSFAATARAPGVPTTTTLALAVSNSAGTSVTDATTTVVDTAATSTTMPGQDPTPPPSSTPPVDPTTPSPPTGPTAPIAGPESAPGTPPVPSTSEGEHPKLPGGPEKPSPTIPAVSSVSVDPEVSYDGGLFHLTGRASSTAGVSAVEISAVLDDGARQDLGAATVDPDGTFVFDDRIGAHRQSSIEATLTDMHGTQEASVDPGFSLAGGLGPHGGAGRWTAYMQGGGMASTSLFHSDGGRSSDVGSSGQTVELHPYEVVSNHHQGSTTFVFDAGDGLDVVHGFKFGGRDHDMLQLPLSDFKSLAEVLAHTGDVAGSAFITDPVTGEAIRLAGVTTAELKAHPKDFIFHP